MNYDVVLADLLDWARRGDNVRTVVLTGSAASSTDHPLSDRDIELHVLDAAPLEGFDGWWTALGEVLVVERLENDASAPTRLVYYVGGKLDFTLIERDDAGELYDRPFHVLMDKDGVAAGFRLVENVASEPDQTEFDDCRDWGYAAALMNAKALVRDEPWSANIRDSDLKAELLRLIEWDQGLRLAHARALLGAAVRRLRP